MRTISPRWWIGGLIALMVVGLLIFIALSAGNSTKIVSPAPIAAQATAVAPTQRAVPSTTVPAATPVPSQPVQLNQPPPGIGAEYLALGDSVAYGVGAPFPEQLGYAGVFYEAYLKRVQPNLQHYKNLALPGETSTTFISRTKNRSQLERALDEIDAAEQAGRHVSPITLTIGGNDMLDARGKSAAEKQATLEQFDANLQLILGQLNKHTEGKADIIVTTYYNPYAFSTGGRDEDTDWIRRFNDTIKKRTIEGRAKIADFFEPTFGREKSLTWIGLGDVHPNTVGHALFASILWKATGYDSQPPTLNLTYSALPEDRRLIAGQRIAFKASAQDGWSVPSAPDALPGAGNISGATISLDNGPKTALPTVPARYNNAIPGSQEFSYLLDSAGLASGNHILRFEAVDSAGNIGKLEVPFEIG